MTRRFTNRPQTTLSSELGSADLVAHMTDGSVFPSSGDYSLLVTNTPDDPDGTYEIILATARSSNNVTVTRHQESTSAATWPAGSTVVLALTKETLEAFKQTTEIWPFVTYSTDGVVTTGQGTKKVRNLTGRDLEIVQVSGDLTIAPTGQTMLVDVNINTTTVFTTQSNRLTFAIGETETTADVIQNPDLGQGDYVRCDVDQIGSTVAGSNLTVTVWVRG